MLNIILVTYVDLRSTRTLEALIKQIRFVRNQELMYLHLKLGTSVGERGVDKKGLANYALCSCES